MITEVCDGLKLAEAAPATWHDVPKTGGAQQAAAAVTMRIVLHNRRRVSIFLFPERFGRLGRCHEYGPKVRLGML